MPGFGSRVKKLLKENRQSQKRLAEETGIPQSTLSDIVKEKKLPSIEKAHSIAAFLNSDLHWLITGKTAPTGRSVAEDTPKYDEKYLEEIQRIARQLNSEERELLLRLAEGLLKKRVD